MTENNNSIIEQIKIYNTRRAVPRWESAVLLVIDMQKYFSRLTFPIIKNVSNMIEMFRKHGLLIVYTRHGHKNPDQDGGMLKEWWDEIILFGSPEWEIIEDIKPDNNEKIVDKHYYSGFRNTELHTYLANHGIQDVVISGVMTNLCCETTARDAFQLGYRVFFLADCTSTVNEDLHLSTLKNLAFGFAHIVSTKDFTPI